MKRVLLVNPPVYDFGAYNFWLKPLGLLRLAGHLHKHKDRARAYNHQLEDSPVGTMQLLSKNP